MSKTTPQFDSEEALEALKSGYDLNGKNGVVIPLIKQLTEAVLAAELEQHIKFRDEQNRRDGSTPKNLKSVSYIFELDVVNTKSALN